jgi:hypothetical protein
MMCPFCANENAVQAVVCGSCARDISAPQSLIAERDDLLRKREMMQQALLAARTELDEFRRLKKRRSP